MKKKIFLIIGSSLILSGCIPNWEKTSEAELGDIVEEEIVDLEKDASIEAEKEVASNMFYYEQLTAEEKGIYDKILENSKEYNLKTTFVGINIDSLYKVLSAFSFDHPEYFWTNEYQFNTFAEYPISVEFTDNSNIKEDAEKINTAIDQIIAGAPANGSDYEKYKYIYEWLINNTDYSPGTFDQDVRSVLFNHKSVCAGYAKTFQLVAQRMGLFCTYVSGQGNGGPHGWNLIRIDGKYYWVDPTWGDPVFENGEGGSLNYDYFCVDDSTIFQTHYLSGIIELQNYTSTFRFVYPPCKDTSYEYYHLKNAFFDEYDREAISEYIGGYIQKNEYNGIEFKFGSPEVYYEACNDLFDGKNAYIFEIIKNNISGKWQNLKYNCSKSDSACRITLDISVKE